MPRLTSRDFLVDGRRRRLEERLERLFLEQSSGLVAIGVVSPHGAIRAIRGSEQFSVHSVAPGFPAVGTIISGEHGRGVLAS
jgi:hypothetical protein